MLPTVKDAAQFGLANTNDYETFDIDLAGTTLGFNVLKRTMFSKDLGRKYQSDLRPYVNTISKAEFYTIPGSKFGRCQFYETAWWLFTGKGKKQVNHGFATLQSSLITPRREDYETFPNLFNEKCLKDWLALYYSDPEAITQQVTYTNLSNGWIQIELRDDDNLPQIQPSEVPLQKLPQLISGMPSYFVYLKPGIIEFNVPLAKRDVLQLRFQIHYQTDDVAIKEQLNRETLKFAHQVVSTVKITLSEREEKNRLMVNTIRDQS